MTKLVTLLILLLCGFAASADPPPAQDRKEPIGAGQDSAGDRKEQLYLLKTPKPGYAGSPAGNYAAIGFGVMPTQDEHYQKQIIRLVHLPVRDLGRFKRTVIRMDLMQSDRTTVLLSGIYYAYVDRFDNGLFRVVGRRKDDNSWVDDADGAIRGIPFLLGCISPPELAGKGGSSYYYVSSCGTPVKYYVPPVENSAERVTLEVTRYSRCEKSVDVKEDVIMIFEDGEEMDSFLQKEGCRIDYLEKQQWERGESGWVWEMVERFDGRGVRILSCTRLE